MIEEYMVNDLTALLLIVLIPTAPLLAIAVWKDYKVKKAEDSKGDYIQKAEEKGVGKGTERVMDMLKREAREGERNVLKLNERQILSFFDMGTVPFLRVGYLHWDTGAPVIEVGIEESLRKWGGPFVGWHRVDVTTYGYEIEITELDEILGEDVIHVEVDDRVGGGHGEIQAAGISTREERKYEDSFGDTIRVTYEREWVETERNKYGWEFTVKEKEHRVVEPEIIDGDTWSEI